MGAPTLDLSRIAVPVKSFQAAMNSAMNSARLSYGVLHALSSCGSAIAGLVVGLDPGLFSPRAITFFFIRRNKRYYKSEECASHFHHIYIINTHILIKQNCCAAPDAQPGPQEDSSYFVIR